MIPIYDIHCHPSLKVYLCNAKIAQEHHHGSDFLPGQMHVDLPGMKTGGVQCVLSFQYIPEAGLGTMRKSKWLFSLMKGLGISITKKIESGLDGNGCFDQAMEGIGKMNDQVKEANDSGAFNITSPKNALEFEAAFNENKMIILHGLEGGHHLGKNLPDIQDYLDNLQKLKEAGVCILTLAHFFPNNLCDSAGGIPPGEAKFFGYSRTTSGPKGLTAIGEAVVNWCQDHGMIIDLVHSSVETRNRVYEILDERRVLGKRIRPIVFSHTGVRPMVAHLMLNEDDQLLLPDAPEILKIQSYGGLIGMILMNYWQNGDDQQDAILENDLGIQLVIDTIGFIKKCTADGDLSYVSIGTDLDGFTTIPRDVSHISKIDKLRQAILANFSAAEAEQICYGNALRVIRENFRID